MAGMLSSLCLCCSLEVGSAITVALDPLRHRLITLKRAEGWAEAYTPGDSALDVMLLSVAKCALLLTLRRDRRVTACISYIFGVALLAKAVVVAILSGGELFSDTHTSAVGVLPLYNLLILCFALGFLEDWIVARIARDRLSEHASETRTSEDSESALEPLLAQSRKPTAAPIQHATIGRLLDLSRQDWLPLAGGFTAGAIASLGNAIVPKLIGVIIDSASLHQDTAVFHSTVVQLLVVAILTAIFTGLRGSCFTLAMTCLNIRIRKQLFASFMSQDIAFYDAAKTGDITSRLAADTSTVSDQIALNTNVLTRSMAQAVIVLVFMFMTSWRLTVVTFIAVPAIIVITKLYGGYMRKISKRVQSALADANSVAEEVLSSMATVRAHAAEDSSKEAFGVMLSKYYGLQLKEAAAYSVYISTATLLPVVVSAGVLLYGGTLVLEGRMSGGGLIAFMLYNQSLSAAFQSMGDVASSITAAVGAADKVIELIDRKPDGPRPGRFAPPSCSGKIELRDVHFAYPTRPRAPVLRGLSLTIQPGEVVALVGPSGGGKSSIVKLIEGYYTPQSGQVLIGDRPVAEYDPKWLKRQVGLVSQEPVLYGRSIKRNILFGLEPSDRAGPTPTQQQIEEAAEQANALEFIQGMPDGFETDTGEKGLTLSVGQKQRIGIARALVRKPSILILDEATAALDVGSEAIVQEALDRVMHGHTVLVVAHRLSTVRDADRILVIQKGQVAEMGSHDELVQKGGLYASMVHRQLSGLARSNASLTAAAGAGSSVSLTSLS